MTPVEIAAQIFGIVGLAFAVLSFQFKKRQLIMIFQMVASVFFVIQMFMLRAFTGAVLDLIAVTRAAVFYFNDKKWASSPAWCVTFCCLMIVSGIVTWQNGWSFLPIAASVFSTIALWMRKPLHTRLMSLPAGPAWMVYAFVTGAYSIAVEEFLAMVSIIIGIIRNDVKK